MLPALTLALLLFAGRVFAAGPAALPVTELAPGVFVHHGQIAEPDAANRGDIANLGFVIGERCIAVIDTGSTVALGRALLAALRSRSSLPVCYVINTHMHFDHSFGNAAFEATGARFVASARMPASLSARAEGYQRMLREVLGEGADAGPVVYPTLLVEDSLTLDLGARRLTLRSWPTAHTDNDLTVYDETSGTLFLGDLLFEGFVPIVDGSLRGWLQVGERLAALPVRHAVAGHGSIELVWPEALQRQKTYLEYLASSVRAALRRGRTLREVIDADDGSSLTGWQLVARFHARNLSAAYAELEWED